MIRLREGEIDTEGTEPEKLSRRRGSTQPARLGRRPPPQHTLHPPLQTAVNDSLVVAPAVVVVAVVARMSVPGESETKGGGSVKETSTFFVLAGLVRLLEEDGFSRDGLG